MFWTKNFASFPCFGLITRVLFAFTNALFLWAVDKSNKLLATGLKSVWPIQCISTDVCCEQRSIYCEQKYAKKCKQQKCETICGEQYEHRDSIKMWQRQHYCFSIAPLQHLPDAK